MTKLYNLPEFKLYSVFFKNRTREGEKKENVKRFSMILQLTNHMKVISYVFKAVDLI